MTVHGQRFDGDFSASKVNFVNHIETGAHGKKCPSPDCGAAPLQRLQMVWAEHSRIGGEHDYIGSVSAPPREPDERHFSKFAFWPAGAIILILLCGSVIGGFQSRMIMPYIVICALLLAPGVILAVFDARVNRERSERHSKVVELWENTWMCKQCGELHAASHD